MAIDIKALLNKAGNAAELVTALENLPQLYARVAALEQMLAGARCPQCNLPGWHESANEPTKGLGAEFGLRDITFSCLKCGYKKTVPPE